MEKLLPSQESEGGHHPTRRPLHVMTHSADLTAAEPQAAALCWPHPAAPTGIPAGRVAIYCPAVVRSCDLSGLKTHLEALGYRCEAHAGVLHARMFHRSGQPASDLFLCSSGAAVMWMNTLEGEMRLLLAFKQYEHGSEAGHHGNSSPAEPPPRGATSESSFMQAEVFALCCCASSSALPFIQDNVVYIGSDIVEGGNGGAALRPRSSSFQHQLALSLALAQSTRLAALENRVAALAAATRHVPLALARQGEVVLGERDAAKLQGAAFRERQQLALAGVGEAGTPAALRRSAVEAQASYAAARAHLEVASRAAVADARLCALRDMLDIARQQAFARAREQQEWAIIWLVAAEVAVLLVQVADLAGWGIPSLLRWARDS